MNSWGHFFNCLVDSRDPAVILNGALDVDVFLRRHNSFYVAANYPRTISELSCELSTTECIFRSRTNWVDKLI